MRDESGTILAWAVRVAVRGGPQAELARQVVLALLVAQMLAAGAHAGPPHPPRRAPRDAGRRRQRLPHRDSLAGRRPRG